MRRRNRRESTRTGKRKPGRQRIQLAPSKAMPPPRHDHVDMRVVGHRRAPSVEHGGDADAGAEVLAVGGDGAQRLGRGPEQEVVDHRLVLVGDGGDLGGQREDHVEVRDRQQVGLAGRQPVPCRRALALRAVPVAAGVIGDALLAAAQAALDMAAERGGAAGLDRRHHLELARLRCPAWARRRAGPWRRKMSAISSGGRPMAAPGQASSVALSRAASAGRAG